MLTISESIEIIIYISVTHEYMQIKNTDFGFTSQSRDLNLGI